MPGLNNWYSITKSESGFDLTFDFSNVKLMSKKDSIDYTVSELAKNHENIYLCLSGGMDSEWVAKCLYEREVKFTPLIVDYESNAAESWYAYYWCHKNNIKPDVIKFTRDEAADIFYQVSSKHQVAYLSALEFIAEEYVSKRNGSLVNAHAIPFDRKYCYQEKIDDSTSTTLDWRSFNFSLDIEIPNKHPTGFVLYTPEILYSQIAFLNYSKCSALSLADFYEITPRPKISALMNLFLSQKAVQDFIKTHRKIPTHQFLFDKDELLNRIRNREVVRISSKLLTLTG